MSGKLTTDVDKRLLRTTKFPPEFNVKVDMTKVNVLVIKRWVKGELERILGSEDEVVTETIFNLIEGSRYPNIKELQISLNGFLDKDAPKFCHELWKYCISAQESPQGVPKELLEAKTKELQQEKLEEDRAREEARKRQEADREREMEIARIRERERSERGRGSGGRYGERDSDRRPFRRDSRSPPRRRRDGDDFYRNPPKGDTYVPGRGRRDDARPPRRRSPSPGRSRSPPPPRRRRRDSTSPSPPPRRRRTSSNDRSASRERGHDRKKGKSGNAGRRSRSRSPPHRRRSRSPRRHRRRSPSHSRSPPPKRTRRPSRSRSRSPPRKKRATLAANDLMARKSGPSRDEPRLSPDPSGTPPPPRRRRNTSSVESTPKPTSADAEEFTFLGAAQRASKSITAPPQQQGRAGMHLPGDADKRRANQLRAQLLGAKFPLGRRSQEALARRKDSAAPAENGKS